MSGLLAHFPRMKPSRWKARDIGDDYEGDLKPSSRGDGRVVRKRIDETEHQAGRELES